MLVHYRELFENDFSGQYAIPAFNTINLETTLGIARAAQAKHAPVIMAVSGRTIEYAGLNTIIDIVSSVANDPAITVPVALHLDHAKDEDLIERAINAGFSSVMIDASSKPYEENLEATQKTVAYAKPKGIWVQAELGKLRGNEDWVSISDAEALYTDPKEAAQFVADTQVNTLAIAVGTIHGIIKFREKITPKLDIERIKAVKSLINIPLILHGASGVDAAQLRQAIEAGMCVVNIDTELRLAFTAGIRQALADESMYDPRNILGPAIDSVQKAAEAKLDELGTSGKAK
ncbi:MAG TPA: class II fructose-bisphosphate aldolase [Flavobacterium sp.]|nr:class II fructose-bisphosphate aldolase [Flavobacterium sp.]